jgi:transcriptional regulator with XRE-family HTH domain/uncharacterized cupin superfamily protein
MPAYPTVASSYADLRLGQRIREERSRHGWKLRDLAERINISIAAISAIENGKTTLDLAQLEAFSVALGVPAEKLLLPRGSNGRHYVVTKQGSDVRRTGAWRLSDPLTDLEVSYHHAARSLADAFVSRHLEPFEIEVARVQSHECAMVSHHHEEFCFVLTGDVECILSTPDGLVREQLGRGDCIHFRSRLPHSFRSLGTGLARTLNVICSGVDLIESEYETGDALAILTNAAPRSLSTQVATKIKRLRVARRMSIKAFAAELAINPRRLKALETQNQPISIDLLLRICSRFKKPLEFFVAGLLAERPFYRLQRAHDIAALPGRVRRDQLGQLFKRQGRVFKSLSSGFEPRGMYPYHLTFPDEQGRSPRLHEHHGQEFLYVLSGQVKLFTTLDGDEVVESLSPGDSCLIDSTVPHQFVGAGVNPYQASEAEAIDVFWCPLGESYLFFERDNDDVSTHMKPRKSGRSSQLVDRTR